MSKALKVIIIIVSIVAILIIAGTIFISKTEKNLEGLSAIQVEDVDLSTIPDGTFEGNYKAFLVAVIVEVTVQDHKITGIEILKHDNGQGHAAEVLPGMVIEAQSLQVDVISGATYSSKVILLAIEDALKSAAEN